MMDVYNHEMEMTEEMKKTFLIDEDSGFPQELLFNEGETKIVKVDAMGAHPSGRMVVVTIVGGVPIAREVPHAFLDDVYLLWVHQLEGRDVVPAEWKFTLHDGKGTIEMLHSETGMKGLMYEIEHSEVVPLREVFRLMTDPAVQKVEAISRDTGAGILWLGQGLLVAIRSYEDALTGALDGFAGEAMETGRGVDVMMLGETETLDVTYMRRHRTDEPEHFLLTEEGQERRVHMSPDDIIRTYKDVERIQFISDDVTGPSIMEGGQWCVEMI